MYFITALNEVQAKLYRLDEENGISRRRVRELEMELEVCKREVARERTRVLEREEMLVQHKFESERRQAKDKGKQKEQDDLEVVERRYREAVEEKKGSYIEFPLIFYADSSDPQHSNLSYLRCVRI